jgi:hypothetical protein
VILDDEIENMELMKLAQNDILFQEDIVEISEEFKFVDSEEL